MSVLAITAGLVIAVAQAGGPKGVCKDTKLEALFHIFRTPPKDSAFTLSITERVRIPGDRVSGKLSRTKSKNGCWVVAHEGIADERFVGPRYLKATKVHSPNPNWFVFSVDDTTLSEVSCQLPALTKDSTITEFNAALEGFGVKSDLGTGAGCGR